jgi:anti-sigma factor (TIGR02949 family)
MYKGKGIGSRKEGVKVTCQDYKKWIHEYLDDELSSNQTKELLAHIDQCEGCRKHLHELEKTILLLKSNSHLKAPDNFTERVMQQLPKETKRVKAKRWMKGHPLVVAASLFIFLMAGSLLTIWTEGQDQFYVSAPNMDQLVVDQKRGTVIVPVGEVIQGDLIVRNGNVEVRGEVTGDVIVTDGQIYLASTAHIVGEVEEIDQFMKWAWVHLQRWVKEAIQFKK